MTQRGANLCGFASDEAHEVAAAEFMKWFTDPEQNAAFAVSTGYIPVEREAFSSLPELLKYVRPEDNNLAVEKSVAAAFEAMESKEFYVKRSFENSYSANQLFGGGAAPPGGEWREGRSCFGGFPERGEFPQLVCRADGQNVRGPGRGGT